MTELVCRPDSPLPTIYDETYYARFSAPSLVTERTCTRALAIADAAGAAAGSRVLDYGCGLGALTGAFNHLGFEATGLDVSPYAVANPVPEAQGCVERLNEQGLGALPPDSFDFAVSKDVFEHVPEQEVPERCDELLRLAPIAVLIIPTVDETGTFIIPHYDTDPTHITRLTEEEWPVLLDKSQASVQVYPELTPKVRRADKVAGTMCVLLGRTQLLF